MSKNLISYSHVFVHVDTFVRRYVLFYNAADETELDDAFRPNVLSLGLLGNMTSKSGIGNYLKY